MVTASPPGSLGRILRDALGAASPADRRILAIMVATWFFLAIVQVWDASRRSGPAAVAELAGVLVLVTGTLLLLAGWTFQARAERAGAGAARPQAVVLALPVLAGIGATCFGFAGAMYITRALLGDEIWLVVLASIAVATVLVLALQLIARTTRSLYVWADERASAAARAEAEADRARLSALTAQMNPHFLFNALNTVASLVPTDAARAERMLENLASVLRQTLQRSTRAVTSVDDEVRFVREYLAIEHERYGSRLSVTVNVDPAAGPFRVPTLSLQPVVENAIEYAVNTRLAGGSIGVDVTVTGGRLRLSVADDGEGFAAGSRDGTGLGNLRQRLAALYGEDGRLTVESSATGSRVTIDIPATAS